MTKYEIQGQRSLQYQPLLCFLWSNTWIIDHVNLLNKLLLGSDPRRARDEMVI